MTKIAICIPELKRVLESILHYGNDGIEFSLNNKLIFITWIQTSQYHIIINLDWKKYVQYCKKHNRLLKQTQITCGTVVISNLRELVRNLLYHARFLKITMLTTDVAEFTLYNRTLGHDESSYMWHIEQTNRITKFKSVKQCTDCKDMISRNQYPVFHRGVEQPTIHNDIHQPNIIYEVSPQTYKYDSEKYNKVRDMLFNYNLQLAIGPLTGNYSLVGTKYPAYLFDNVEPYIPQYDCLLVVPADVHSCCNKCLGKRIRMGAYNLYIKDWRHNVNEQIQNIDYGQIHGAIEHGQIHDNFNNVWFKIHPTRRSTYFLDYPTVIKRINSILHVIIDT